MKMTACEHFFGLDNPPVNEAGFEDSPEGKKWVALGLQAADVQNKGAVLGDKVKDLRSKMDAIRQQIEPLEKQKTMLTAQVANIAAERKKLKDEYDSKKPTK